MKGSQIMSWRKRIADFVTCSTAWWTSFLACFAILFLASNDERQPWMQINMKPRTAFRFHFSYWHETSCFMSITWPPRLRDIAKSNWTSVFKTMYWIDFWKLNNLHWISIPHLATRVLSLRIISLNCFDNSSTSRRSRRRCVRWTCCFNSC